MTEIVVKIGTWFLDAYKRMIGIIEKILKKQKRHLPNKNTSINVKKTVCSPVKVLT